jgi:hypothetical protein
MTTLPGRVIGAKPAAFCRWLFDLLGALPGDHFEDLFPGSSAVTRAWTAYTATGEPSRQARDDTSPQVLHDASPAATPDTSGLTRGVASPGPHDASRTAGAR